MTALDWDPVADAWDRYADDVEEHSVIATDAMVAAADVRPGDRLLELAAGPGGLGRRWSELVGPTGHVTLSDVSPAMVEVARRRSADAGVEHAVLDATAIARPDGAFDVVACRMGLMFAPDPAVALGEIHRILVPGGRLAALTWSAIEHNPWMTCVGVAAMIHGVVSGGPPVGPGGVFSLGDPDHLAALATAAGFDDVAVDEVPVTFRAPSIDVHVERVGALAGPMAAAFAAATPEQRAAVRDTAAQLAAEHTEADGSLALPGRAVLLAGRA